MKMSDVFSLPLTSDYDTVSDRSMTNLATFDTCKEDEAAVHAINNHDKLVEALEVMIACTDKDIYPAFVDQAKEVLRQAKRGE